MTFTGRRPYPAVPNWAALSGEDGRAERQKDGAHEEAEERPTPTREAFLRYDTSGDGRLNVDEVRAMGQQIRPGQPGGHAERQHDRRQPGERRHKPGRH